MASTGGHSRVSLIVHKLLIVSALVTVGCYKAMGGGSIQSAPSVGADRATFGFTVQCRDTRQRGTPVAVLSSGELDWHDGHL